jgi:hypothetical protein
MVMDAVAAEPISGRSFPDNWESAGKSACFGADLAATALIFGSFSER